jgi:hypothetical protein
MAAGRYPIVSQPIERATNVTSCQSPAQKRALLFRSSEASNIDKLGPGTHRAGEFVITRMGSRWRSQAGQSVLNKGFSTLGGAAAWCRQHGEARNNVTNFDDEDAGRSREKADQSRDRIRSQVRSDQRVQSQQLIEVALDRLRVREPRNARYGNDAALAAIAGYAGTMPSRIIINYPLSGDHQEARARRQRRRGGSYASSRIDRRRCAKSARRNGLSMIGNSFTAPCRSNTSSA